MHAIVDVLFSYRVTDMDRYRTYLGKILPLTESREPYVLSYEIFEGTDGTYYQHERYENEEAIVKHLEVTSSAQEDFHAATEMTYITMLGSVSDDFRKAWGVETEFKPFKAITR